MNDAAIQNLDYLRELISAARAEEAFRDAERLRMLQYGLGMNNITAGQDDR